MARKYGRVEAMFWKNPKVRQLKDPAKLLYLYLVSCDHGNSVGCYVLPPGYIESDLGWSRKQVEEQVSILVSKGFIERADASFLTLIRGWWGHNSIDNGKMAKAVDDFVRTLPRDDVVYPQFIKGLAAYIKANGNEYLACIKTSTDTGIDSPYTEPEPEPEPESRSVAPQKPSPKRPRAKPAECDPDGFAEFWAAYPKKTARPDAIKAFLSARKRASLGEIMGGLRRSVDNWRATRTKLNFCPAAGPWLRGERWADELPDPDAQVGIVRGMDPAKFVPRQTPNIDINSPDYVDPYTAPRRAIGGKA